MARLPERLMMRRGTYYCRVWVPRDVVTIFGRQLVVTSLRTGDLKIAKVRLARKTVELEDHFEAIRANQNGPHMSALTDPSKQKPPWPEILRTYRTEVEDHAYVERLDLYRCISADPAGFWKGEIVALPTPADFGHGEQDAYTYFDHLVAEGDLDRVIAFVVRWRLEKRIRSLATMKAVGNLEEHLGRAKARLPDATPSEALRLARLFVDEESAVLQAIVDGAPAADAESAAASSHQLASPLEAEISAWKAQPVQRVPSVTLDELFERWEQETEPSASTLSSWRGIVRNLKGHLGKKSDDIGLIAPADIVSWKDKLVASRKAAATISNGYLACARALFRFAVANKLLAADPAEGIKLSRKMKAGTRMLGYERHEVARLLALASACKEPWKKWLPWLAAATGSRIGEVAQLHGANVFESEGFAVVRISPTNDGGSIKNPESERIVPLHSALIREGFLEFVRSRGDGPLFYGRTSGDPKRRHASKAVSNRLAGWIRVNGFNDARKAPNHALRHWFKSEASRAGIPDSVADAIQGHTDGRASSSYRHIDLSQMAKAIERIQLPPRDAR